MKRIFAIGIITGMWLLVSVVTTADDQDIGNSVAASVPDPHAGHKMKMARSSISRSADTYELRDLQFVDMHGNDSIFEDFLATDKPILLHFIFTTCTTICPVQAATFSQVQRRLGDQAEDIIFISVSIDPEHDTPTRLREYAAQFNAGPQWQFLTGSVAEMISIQKSFDAYHGAKMNHRALTMIKSPGGEQWIRLEGMASAADIIAELETIKSIS